MARPSSRASFRFRLSPIDLVWAALAPLLALYLRDALVLSVNGAPTAFLYCSLSFVFTLIAFLAFRVSAGISRYFSVHDAVSILSAVIAAGLTTTVVLFTFTRLEGIPRSLPVMQGLVLAAGLLLTRGLMRLWDKDDAPADAVEHSAVEHIIMIGSSRLTSLYIKLLQAHAPAQRQVIAVLDDNPKLFGRTMCGIPVVGAATQLDAVVEELPCMASVPTASSSVATSRCYQLKRSARYATVAGSVTLLSISCRTSSGFHRCQHPGRWLR
jgi:FlaA1/EpsC-like NDP-sugar epimerase